MTLRPKYVGKKIHSGNAAQKRGISALFAEKTSPITEKGRMIGSRTPFPPQSHSLGDADAVISAQKCFKRSGSPTPPWFAGLNGGPWGVFFYRGAWWLCCARSPFPAGAGNSFPKALRASLRCRQGKRPAQGGRDERPMRPNRLGPSHEGMRGAEKAGQTASRYIAQLLDEYCGMKEDEGKRDMENSGNRNRYTYSLPDSVGQAVLHLGDQVFLDSRMDTCTVKRAAV